MAKEGTPSAYRQQFVLVGGRPEEVRQAQEALRAAVEARRFDPNSCFAIRLALEEALSNAIKHGNQNDPRKIVRLEFRVDQSSVTINVEDQGFGFDPQAVPDPTEQENLQIPSGRGIVLMKSFMTEVTFLPPGNKVHMVFRRPSAEASASSER